MEERVKFLEQFESSQLVNRIVLLQENYNKILGDLEFKNQELRKILAQNKIIYDSLRFVLNDHDKSQLLSFQNSQNELVENYLKRINEQSVILEEEARNASKIIREAYKNTTKANGEDIKDSDN